MKILINIKYYLIQYPFVFIVNFLKFQKKKSIKYDY